MGTFGSSGWLTRFPITFERVVQVASRSTFSFSSRTSRLNAVLTLSTLEAGFIGAKFFLLSTNFHALFERSIMPRLSSLGIPSLDVSTLEQLEAVGIKTGNLIYFLSNLINFFQWKICSFRIRSNGVLWRRLYVVRFRDLFFILLEITITSPGD